MRYSSKKCGLRRELEQPRGGIAAEHFRQRSALQAATCCCCSCGGTEVQGHFTGASVRSRNCERPSHDGERFLFVARPSSVSFSPATNAGMVALFTVSLGGKKVRGTAPVQHARFGRQNPSNLPSPWNHLACQPQWCLTPRSRRGPTSKHQARAAGGRIFHRAGLAFCCRPRLSSNVRPHNKTLGEASARFGCSARQCLTPQAAD